MEKRIVVEIQKLVEEKRRSKGIINDIIRDDVFLLLQGCDCTVLYYPISSADRSVSCDGMHIEKPVNNKLEQFVFINTINTKERQVFTAAHELGHIWEIDIELSKRLPDIPINAEEVINRFAAELLMPEKIFINILKKYLDKIEYNNKGLDLVNAIKMVAHLMNYFFVPFKSVVCRLNELGKLNDEDMETLLKYKDDELVRKIVRAEPNQRVGIADNLKSIDNLKEYLLEAEELDLLSQQKLRRIRREFEIVVEEKYEEKNFTIRE